MKKFYIAFFLLLITFGLVSCKQDLNNKISKIKYDEKVKFNVMSMNNESKIDYSYNEQEVIEVVLNIDMELYSNQNLRETNYDAYLEQINSYYTTRNQELNNQLNFVDYDSCFISDYSPLVKYSYSYDNFIKNENKIIDTIESNPKISSARIKGYKIDKKNNNEYMGFSVTDDGLNLEEIYDNRTLTGDKIKVGILDSGEVDFTQPEFQNVDHEVYTRPNSSISAHATNMARIIASDYGLAPDAKVYSAKVIAGVEDEFSWFINNGVHIINFSAGFGTNMGTYDDESAYFDYIVASFDVVIVVAAGNSGLNDDETPGLAYVDNPGLGYNVITAGSSNMNRVRLPFSSYNVTMGPYKPTIMAPGGVYLDGIEAVAVGTSVSTALITGALALLFERFKNLTYERQRVISLVTANANKFADYSYSLNNGFDNEIGAGSFNFQLCLDNTENSQTYTNNTNEHNAFVKSVLVALEPGQRIDASLAWLVSTYGTTSSLLYTDYDLRLYSMDNVKLASGASGYNNIETLTYTNTTDSLQVLTLKVYQYGYAAVQDEKLGIAYHITDTTQQ